MNIFLKHRVWAVLAVVAVGVMTLQPTACLAQQASLPEGWQQMSASDLVTALRALDEQRKLGALSEADLTVVRTRCKELFEPIDLLNTQLDYQTIQGLHEYAGSLVADTVNERTRNALLARQDDWTGKSYFEIRAKFWLMEEVKIPRPTCIAEGRRWVQAGGTAAQIPKEDLANEVVRQCLSDIKAIPGSFSVQWESLVNAPETGNYTFSVSPINVSSKDPKLPVKLSMNASVEGQQILNATPENWVSQSTPVTLTAGQPVALQVNLSAEAHEIPPFTMHAQLIWQGPGTTKQVIPTNRLTQPGTGDPGFRATYTWKDENGQPQTLSRTDRMIDFAWTNAAIYLAADTTLSDQAADTVWQDVSTEEYLTWCESSGPEVKWHPYFREIRGAPTGLSSARRQSFLGKLLAHPALLDVLSPKDAVNLYQGFRYGAEDKALEVFGKWATRQSDWQPSLSGNMVFEGENRDAFRRMAIYMTRELPDHVTRLQSDYLELPDGRCCLPVAYTLVYSYLGKGQMDQWLALLDARLADNAVTGDKRVNWLLARAHAEEIRDSQADPYAIPAPRLLDGRGYLNEGLIVVESPAVKARIAKEIAARLVSTQQFTAAKDVLQQAASSLPEAESTLLQTWLQQIAAIEAASAQARQAHAMATQEAYLATLRKRRDRSVAAGDTNAANRYDSLIEAATVP